jgi:hypothetical protein
MTVPDPDPPHVTPNPLPDGPRRPPGPRPQAPPERPPEPEVRRPLRDGAMTGRRRFDGAGLDDYAAPQGLLGRIARRRGVVVPAPSAVAPGDPLPARIYEDKWIVDCDYPGCGGASFVWPDAPRFLCAECFNGAQGGLWRRVALPAEEDAAEIEEVLGHRAHPSERNWSPGESVDDLRKENRDHGVFVPPSKRPRPGSRGLPGDRTEKEER